MRTKVAVVVLLVLGAGCLILAVVWGRLTGAPQAASRPTIPATPTPTPTSALAPAPAQTPELAAAPSPSGDRDMIWSTATDRPAVPVPVQAGSAVHALTAFLRPSSAGAAKTWWSSLRPLLTTGAQQDYALTDPAQVPPTRITGAPAELVVDEGADDGEDNGHEAEVSVVAIPTDAGVYAVWVITDGPETGKVSRIRPAQS